ncbi:hypothetical protein OC846_006031 [Tilletia horrida]|uniref:FAD dependent oxidoreductase domain-containing protein n=1 Tax=Tilletia horrida TaxID=155126 RepID=A0AAN6GME4_9BASI|nr:hypothetical protein OC846_006031 [Tilletia horrida]
MRCGKFLHCDYRHQDDLKKHQKTKLCSKRAQERERVSAVVAAAAGRAGPSAGATVATNTAPVHASPTAGTTAAHLASAPVILTSQWIPSADLSTLPHRHPKLTTTVYPAWLSLSAKEPQQLPSALHTLPVPPSPSSAPRKIGIVGGGFSGCARALDLSGRASLLGQAVHITIIEPKAPLADGSGSRAAGFVFAFSAWHWKDTPSAQERANQGARRYGFRYTKAYDLGMTTQKGMAWEDPMRKFWVIDNKKVFQDHKAFGDASNTVQLDPCEYSVVLREHTATKSNIEARLRHKVTANNVITNAKISSVEVQCLDTDEKTTLELDDIVFCSGAWTEELLRKCMGNQGDNKELWKQLPRFFRRALYVGGSRHISEIG